jgi:hypothetical protein
MTDHYTLFGSYASYYTAKTRSPGTGRICLIRSVVVRTLPIGGAEKGA